jgi:hypothetical protein
MDAQLAVLVSLRHASRVEANLTDGNRAVLILFIHIDWCGLSDRS